MLMRTTEVTPATRDATRDLVAATRRFMLAMVESGMNAEQLREVTMRVDELTGSLPSAVRRGALRLPFEEPAQALERGVPHPMGGYSPFSMRLDMAFDPEGRSVRADFVADPLLEGPPTAIHGGVISWIFDIVLGVLVQAQGEPAVTKSLTVEYLRPTPINAPLVAEARLVEREGTRTLVEGSISSQGKVTARSCGVFVRPTRMPGAAPDGGVQ